MRARARATPIASVTKARRWNEFSREDDQDARHGDGDGEGGGDDAH